MIERRVEDDVTVVVLDRPERRNALTPDGLEALGDAIEGATTPVVYLTGAGSAFCAGADLDVVEGLDRDDAEAFARLGQRTARRIETARTVVVVGVDGAARGGGVELALAADLRIGTPDATFAEPGVSFGLFGAWGGTARLPGAVGRADAFDLALSGRVVDASEALRMGLISRVVDDPRTVADAVAENDPDALATVKERLRDDASARVQERREAEAFADLVGSGGVDTRGRKD